ncbi:ABC transporter ATP-binding protein [Oleispirillum naphthae]|uniref:ABC transporter ATP-binding protein n=1 Tax=Oleispirillum naphthae TaxID=2838853 RepID=UPI003082261F
MLEIAGLCAGYGAVQVLFGLSLAVGGGEAVALIGRNGAGKSTTLKSAMGLTDITAGEIRFEGENITGCPPHAAARAGLGWVPEDRRVFARLTVWENLDVGRRAPRPGAPAWDEDRVLAVFPHLKTLLKRDAGLLSGGEQQMLTVARTLMGQPRMLLLDEPSEGIAPKAVEDLAAALAEIKATGVGILLSEQNRGFAAALADRAVLLDRGRVIGEGRLADLIAEGAQLAACLGV